MLLMSWFVLVLFSGFIWSMSLLDKSQFTDSYTGYDSLYLNALIGDFYIIFFYLVVKISTGQMRLVKSRCFFLIPYERIIFPVMAIFFPVLFDEYSINNVVNNNSYYIANTALLFLLFLDPLNNIHKYYLKTGVYSRNNESYLYLSFPPDKCIDLVPFFILIHGMYFIIGLI